MPALANPLAQEATARATGRAPVLGEVLFYGLISLLMFGPIAFGAVEPWSILILEAGAALLFVIWAVQQAVADALVIVGSSLFPPMLAFGILILLQLSARLTAYRYATTSTALLYFAYGLVCFLFVQSFREARQLKILVAAFCAFGGLISGVALLQGIASNGKLFWLRSPGAGWIYGPYINHNHYSGLMEMLLPIPLIFGLTRFATGKRKLIALGIAVLMATTIFLSGSRGGMLAFAVQAGILAAVLTRQKTSRPTALAGGILLVGILALAAWIGGAELSTRLASIHREVRQELSGGTRASINRDGLKMVSLKPIFGWGLGVFPTVYPEFRSFPTNLFVNQAHNDYLQLLVETGLLGFGIMLSILFTAYWSAIRRMGGWQQQADGAVALAALLGITGIVVHSFLDFNLQIPANAMLFYALCTIAAMKPHFKLSKGPRGRRRRSKSESLETLT